MSRLYTDGAVRIAFETWAKDNLHIRLNPFGDAYRSVAANTAFRAFKAGFSSGETLCTLAGEAPPEVLKNNGEDQASPDLPPERNGGAIATENFTLLTAEKKGASIIFLDIDGVLNDHRKWASKHSPILYENVRHLNTILYEVPKAKIVLSSAWRYVFNTVPTIETLLMCHGADCYGRVLGATCSDEEMQGGPMPDFDDKERWATLGQRWRVGQIERYLKSAEPGPYVVLDDLPLSVNNLIKTAPNVGLTAADAQTAIEMLKAERYAAPRIGDE